MTGSATLPVRTLLSGLALLLVVTSARADMTKDECVDANTAAQSLRRGGKLAQARVNLHACGDPSCPALVREDCARRLDEIERAQPTIVFDVKDPAGADVLAVRVTADGQPVADKLEGTPLAIDPGEHELRFEVPGQPVVTRALVIKEGEKDRLLHVVVGIATPASPALAPPEPRATAPRARIGTQRALGLTAAGTGVAGVAVGAVIGLMASARWNDAKSECGTAADCPAHAQAVSDRSATVTLGAGSTVAFVVGGVLLASGAVLYLTGGKSSRDSAISIRAEPGPGVSRVSLEGRF
jgi:hypothetical protein